MSLNMDKRCIVRLLQDEICEEKIEIIFLCDAAQEKTGTQK